MTVPPELILAVVFESIVDCIDTLLLYPIGPSATTADETSNKVRGTVDILRRRYIVLQAAVSQVVRNISPLLLVSYQVRRITLDILSVTLGIAQVKSGCG